MKNLIIVGLLAAVLITPSFASAQTAPVSNEQLHTLLLQLLDVYQKLLADLTAQLAALQSSQAQQGQTLGAIQTSIQPTYTAPVVSEPIITLGTPFCHEKHINGDTVRVPINISGSNWEYGMVQSVPETKAPYTEYGWSAFTRTGYSAGYTPSAAFDDNQGTTTITVQLGLERRYPNDISPIPTQTFTKTIIVGKVCQ